jgi:cyclophilin family peptidyl-prolyl cis-trans isomerase
LSTDRNRERPRSSKKRRAVRPGAGSSRPATERVARSGPRVRAGTARRGGIPTWLLGVAAVVITVGIGVASGVIRFGGGTPGGDAGAAAAGHIAGCPTAQPPPAGAGSTSVVTIASTLGNIELTLKADLSPIAVGNFVALAKCGFYDGVVFHRVVPGFVVQGGDGQYGRAATYGSGRAGAGGPGYDIQDEAVKTTYQRGTVAMARSSQPNSAGSQFFIVLDDGAQASLASANTYQIIGAATKGMDVVDAIAAAADAEKPSKPVVMTKVTVAP